MSTLPRVRTLAAAVVLALVFVSAGHKASSATRRAPAHIQPCGQHTAKNARYDHVVWIVMENKSFGDVIGSSSAPFTNALASACGLAENFHGETHPSLPNYIAMTSGSTHRIRDDAAPSSHRLRGASIFSQLGRGWRALQQSMPRPCARTDSGRYAVRHNPATYYTSLRRSCARQNVRLRTGTPDISARFTFITPNLCSDTHDCGVSTGDRFLRGIVTRIGSSAEYRQGRTALFITWDEDDGSASNHIPTLVVAPGTPAGTTSRTRFNHYSLLRTTEELLGIRHKLGAAARARSMRGAFGL
ncbi:MAG TPA: alkaline phosphatase family protein [Thermoleophilaceae bacterium]|nr:alkaline phosphatase family protein [Thermoleophilaceae bacterium]